MTCEGKDEKQLSDMGQDGLRLAFFFHYKQMDEALKAAINTGDLSHFMAHTTRVRQIGAIYTQQFGGSLIQEWRAKMHKKST